MSSRRSHRCSPHPRGWSQLDDRQWAWLHLLDFSRTAVDPSHLRAMKGGPATGPSPVDRAKTGSKHHVIVEAHGIDLAAILTGGNRNDVARGSEAAGVHRDGGEGSRRQWNLLDHPGMSPPVFRPHLGS
jgi:hypothetical protein